MEVAYSHAQNQRLLKQRNLLLLAASALAVLAAILLGLVTVLCRSPISLCHLGFERERADAA